MKDQKLSGDVSRGAQTPQMTAEEQMQLWEIALIVVNTFFALTNIRWFIVLGIGLCCILSFFFYWVASLRYKGERVEAALQL